MQTIISILQSLNYKCRKLMNIYYSMDQINDGGIIEIYFPLEMRGIEVLWFAQWLFLDNGMYLPNGLRIEIVGLGMLSLVNGFLISYELREFQRAEFYSLILWIQYCVSSPLW